jgi:tripartite-type tricarboxylate transporter receptor subunit TctC
MRSLLTLAAAFMLVATTAHADTFPSRPIRLIIPTPPGGATDNIARPLADMFYREFGQPAVIEARVGGANIIAMETLVRSPPDGHTLLVCNNAGPSILPHTRKLSFDADKDVAPIAMLTDTISGVVIKPSLPVKTFKEFMDYSRANPGTVHYGAAAPGTITHMRNEMLNRVAELKMVHVPYKGDADIFVDMLSGVIDFAASSAALTFARDDKLRLVAFMANKRHPDYPDIPTVNEVVPAFYAPTWYGLYATGATPEPIQQKLNAAVVKWLQMPEVAQRLLMFGMVPQPEDLATFRATALKDRAAYGKIVADLGIKPEG